MQNVSALLYLVSAVLFILSLKGLSSPATSRRGNTYGMVGMGIAVATTFLVMDKPVLLLIVGAMVAGAAIGAFKAKTVEMTHMPELVAAMHSLVGLSAVLIAVAAIFHTGVEHTPVQQGRVVYRRVYWGDYLYRFGDCLRQAVGQIWGEAGQL